MLPVEMETYYLNITKANIEDKATWELYHTYTEAFDMPDLSPMSILKYSERVQNDEETAKYYRNMRYVGGGTMDLDKKCDYEHCRKTHYCQISTSDFDEELACMFTAGQSPFWPLNFDYAWQLILEFFIP